MTTEHPRTFWGGVRSTFLRGAVIIMPLALTVWFFIALWRALDGILSPLFAAWLGREIPGLGFLSMIVIILLVGLLTRNLVGRLFVSWFENVLRSIPFVRSVYGAIRDLVNAFSLGGKGRTFREVVMLEYPRPGLYSLGFVTNEMLFERDGGTPLRLLNLYIPNPPNPTSGVLILAPEGEVVHLDLTIEQGLKLVLSGGIVTPERFAPRRPVRT
jgi:uncharacterized membrane protein